MSQYPSKHPVIVRVKICPPLRCLHFKIRRFFLIFRLSSNKTMLNGTEIRTEHKDVIHDVSYDYYGKRMATCSSDQTVKVKNYKFLHSPLYKAIPSPFRSGTKPPTASGRSQPVGRRIRGPCGVLRGPIRNSDKFSPHAPSTALPWCGRRR